MSIKRINESPTIADQVLIELNTPDADGCFLANPYKVNKVIIYYIERTYGGANYTSYDRKIYDDALKTQLDQAIATACNDPSETNLAEVEKLRSQLDLSATVDTFYYTSAKPVAIFGNEDTPAWLSSSPDSPDNSILNIEEDDDGNTLYG